MFEDSEFNNDISKWDMSNVVGMAMMFNGSKFNGDISNWDVSNVKSMDGMFSGADFTGNLSNWKPYNLESGNGMFLGCSQELCPYWLNFGTKEKTERNKAIDIYHLNTQLKSELSDDNNKAEKKVKI